MAAAVWSCDGTHFKVDQELRVYTEELTELIRAERFHKNLLILLKMVPAHDSAIRAIIPINAKI